ncbi:MAG TPA: DUF448 domain-containing protein [Acidimicrobiaceae bacterium]|nr:DUF448 domain-containing protein [Acidimicrobiaceae bacterium]
MSSPTRTCIGCQRSAGTDELVRMVRSQEGTVEFGRTLPGRGAWLCIATLSECAALALRRRAFERAFRGPVDHASVESAVHNAADSVRDPEQNARG